MRSIGVKAVTEANYSLYRLDDNLAYLESYEQLLSLFNKYKSAFARISECSIPYYWSPTVLGAMSEIVKLDRKTAFVNIKEKNSKLLLDFWYPSAAIGVRDIVYQVKNDIDQLVHDRVRKMLAQRKFNYVPEEFRQLIPEKYS